MILYKKTLLILFICSPALSHAQAKHDYTWLLGYGPNSPSSGQGGTLIDFNSDVPSLDYFPLPVQFDFLTSCTLSDANGNLLFFTNGCKVINSQNEMIENGHDINAGPVHDDYCSARPYDYDDFQGLLAIPHPAYHQHYLLFHITIEPPPYTGKLMKLCYSHIDMTANNGHGKVMEKNQVVFGPDSLQLSITATRHANGRDWWIMVGRRTSNVFYTFLVSAKGVDGPIIQDWRDTWIKNQPHCRGAAFSPDGSKFIRLSGGKPAAFTLFDFDRCEGRLLNPVKLTLPDSIITLSWPAFSPNSRFLYVTNLSEYLYQFDLYADDINSSRKLVGVWDGFIDTTLNAFPTSFHTMANGPDGKIYMSTQSVTQFLHTIHAPDEPGAACDFRQHDVLTPTRIAFFLPNFPHYRLYDLPGSPCDTLGINQTPRPPGEINTFRLAPNPTGGDTELFFAWPAEAGHHLLVYNMLGQLLYETTPESGTESMILPSSTWLAGSYTVVLEQDGRTIYAKILGKRR